MFNVELVIVIFKQWLKVKQTNKFKIKLQHKHQATSNH